MLAALYTVGVATLFALLAVVDYPGMYVDSLESAVAPFGVFFGIAFLILTFARRIGFVALWGLLSALWISLLRGGGYALPSKFVQWSVFAVPLYLIGLIAVRRAITFRVGTRTLSPVILVAGFWIGLAIGGYLLRDYAFPPMTEAGLRATMRVNVLGWVVWAPAPFVITAVAVAAMWIGSRGGKLIEGGLTRA